MNATILVMNKSSTSYTLFEKALISSALANTTIVENRETLANIVDRIRNYTNAHQFEPRDVRVFGLEDENGQTIKVTVAKEDSGSFELELQDALAHTEDEFGSISIAELLYSLRDRFDIVNIEWPEIEEDEEVPQRATSTTTGEEAIDTELDVEALSDTSDTDSNDDHEPDDNSVSDNDTESVKSLLAQFIELMQAETSARMKEAEARAKEAEAREQELAIQQISARVKQEEQILDMEADIKARKEQDREVKQLAQLSKWKHDLAREQGIEDEESWEVPLPKPRRTAQRLDDKDKGTTASHRERAKELLRRLR